MSQAADHSPSPDPFTLFHEWANKPLDSMLTIDSEIYEAVMSLSEEDRMDREKVNEAVAKRNVPFPR